MNYRNLFANLEKNLARIERSDDVRTTLRAVLERLVEDFRDDLGLEGGRLYVRHDDDFVDAGRERRHDVLDHRGSEPGQ